MIWSFQKFVCKLVEILCQVVANAKNAKYPPGESQEKFNLMRAQLTYGISLEYYRTVGLWLEDEIYNLNPFPFVGIV